MRLLPFCALALLALSACQERSAVDKEMAAYEASKEASQAANLKAGKEFLEKAAREPGVVALPSGVLYKVVSHAPTPGAQPKPTDTVTINYEGKLIGGQVFDSSFARNKPATFPLEGLIPAWKEVIPLLHVGDEVMLYTPPSAGYGARDSDEIPANSTLIFRIQLLGTGVTPPQPMVMPRDVQLQ